MILNIYYWTGLTHLFRNTSCKKDSSRPTPSREDHEFGPGDQKVEERDKVRNRVMANCSVDDTFQLPWIAKFFHSFAHVNFYFHNVSSVFAPTLQDYQQVGKY